VTLAEAMAGIQGARLDGSGGVEVASVAVDSRRAGPGTVFAALRGERFDGLRFAEEAVARGAVAVLAADQRPAGCCLDAAWITAPDPRKAAGLLAREIHGRPDESLAVAGVTGTNGKTSVTRLLAAALEAGGVRTGELGTLGYRWADEELPGERTTPEAPDLYRYLRAMVEAGCGACALEVSSHGLDRERVAGLRFRTATFTNLSPDHLDYHRDIDAYFEAKARLFSGLEPEATAVINADDSRSDELARRTRATVVTYGARPGAGWRIEGLRVDARGNGFRLEGPDGTRFEVTSPLPGRVNAANVAAAVATAVALGVPAERAVDGASSVTSIAGRFERVDLGQPFAVWVDYAHTEDALVRALETAREAVRGRVIVVFGCGGERDRGKRPRMGAAAAAGADLVIATSDNPRGEDPAAILEEIRPGLAGSDHVVEPDRLAAIRRAVDEAAAGDGVLIAGKGHETEQVVAGRAEPFDDREAAREALETRRRRGAGRWS
jgi:UDP-N-acetylmuramoyl-L-alanyl-D-glutamate--2,6-diaminopimelate ligase